MAATTSNIVEITLRPKNDRLAGALRLQTRFATKIKNKDKGRHTMPSQEELLLAEIAMLEREVGAERDVAMQLNRSLQRNRPKPALR